MEDYGIGRYINGKMGYGGRGYCALLYKNLIQAQRQTESDGVRRTKGD